MAFWWGVLIVAVAATAAFASDAAEICGRSFDDPHALLQTMRSDPQFEPLSGNDFYIAFAALDDRTVWTFTTPQHEAYPAVACRTLSRNDDDAWQVETHIRCWGTQSVCDRLRDAFDKLDRDMADYLERQQQQSGNGI
jgi:hypothetical protein